jgi:aspartate/tyrosine/aromatic aminotransferase
MPYALIPEGFKLEKVTKAQEEAVKAKRRHDDTVALLNNPNTPIIAAGTALVIATPLLIDILLKRIEALELPGVNLPTPEDIIQIKKEAQESLPAQVLEAIVNQSGFLSFIGLSPAELQRKKAGEAIIEELGL